MPWRLVEISDEEVREATKGLTGKKARFLVDHDVDAETAPFLKSKGWNVVTVREVGLDGRPDDDVFNFAHRDDRIILTHDTDFLNDRRFPEYRNPGIVVLPGGSGDTGALVGALLRMLAIVGPDREVYRGVKLTFNADGSIQSRRRHRSTGAMTTNRYRITGAGRLEQWADE